MFRYFSLIGASFLAITVAFAEDGNTPGYNHKIPDKIMTPDSVETSLGTLKFFDGMPDDATVDKLYDNLVANLTFVDQHRNDWPADMYEADRHITHAVVAALYDIDLSKTGDTAKLPSHTLDGGAPRPADGGMANENK